MNMFVYILARGITVHAFRRNKQQRVLFILVDALSELLSCRALYWTRELISMEIDEVVWSDKLDNFLFFCGARI